MYDPRCKTALGWTFRGSSYCQLIRHANKQKQLDWAERHTDLAFNDVVWTDECTVQLESHRRFCCRKRGQPAKNKPRYTECVAAVFIAGILRTCTCIQGRMCLHINCTLHPLLTNHFVFPPCSCNDFERFVASFFINHSHPLVGSVNTLISMFSSLQP